MLPSIRPFVGIALVVGVLTPFVLTPRSTPADTHPILQVHGASITAYRLSANTIVQEARPLALQRATFLDGTTRSTPTQRMAVSGNPFEDGYRAPALGGLDLANGTFSARDVDTALPAEGFSWVVGRSYNPKQVDSSSAHFDSNGYQGYNWFQNSQPEIRIYDDATDTEDIVYLIFGIDAYVEYKRVATGGNTFKGTNGAAGVFLFTPGTSGAPDTYVLTEQHGNTLTFFGFNSAAGAAQGQIWKIHDVAGNLAYVGDSTSAGTAISAGYDSAGRIKTVYDTSGRRYSYTYTLLDGFKRLTQVLVEKDLGSWVTVGQVDYAYYSDESHGDAGDLKQVSITTPLTDGESSLIQKKYFRYWESSYPSVPGYPHALKYVVDYEGVRRFDWLDSTFDDDHFQADDEDLAPYASAYFEYDGQHRVSKAWFNGECGCSGGTNGTYEIEYEQNANFSDTQNSYDQGWLTRTIIKRPDLSYMTQYWDEAGQALSTVITSDDPDNTSPSPQRWATSVTRDTSGRVISVATPANCAGYNHSSGAISSGTTGLVWEYTRVASGYAAEGFIAAQRYKEVASGTAYYLKEWEYGQADLVIDQGNAGETVVVHPVLWKEHNYQVKGADTANRITTTYTQTWYSGTLSIDKEHYVQPAISLSKNGSGAELEGDHYYRLDGTLSYEKERHGILKYWAYTDGQLTSLIEDADTAQLSDEPTGLTSISGAYHRVTTFTYDDQGRLDVTTYPDGRAIKNNYSGLADGRAVALAYNDYESTPKYYGPVSYAVRNLAGNTEVQATVALTNNESTSAMASHVDESLADPLTAMDLGTVVRLRTQIYNETGHQVLEARSYFSVPTSGAGTDGTNYDATTYGYDESGRKVRAKPPHGTVTRTVYDKLDRVTGTWLGTNDHSFAGGETSGTDNMVQTEVLEYDGNTDDGNGYLTKRTLYVESGTGGQRVTTYANDAFGRVLLQTNPTAPHVFIKYDNEGRNLATGLFSSTGGIVVGTDDPTTETANRLALTESFYDEIGQMWKSRRANIASDGSIVGSPPEYLDDLYWRDAIGRLRKEDGPQLIKIGYDRVSRVLRRYILISDNDTTYATVIGVGGDYVAEENQTVFESSVSDNVLMSVRLDRKHTDGLGPNDTKGALDTNADADYMLLTSSDLKGRAQITAFWYDRFGRVTDQVEYGNYGGATFDRDALSVPSRSDTAIVTSFAYDTDGELLTTTDPRGLVARTERDQAGRTVKEIRNYSASVNSGNPYGSDDNQTVTYGFVDGLQSSIVAVMPDTADNQVTTYIYGTNSGTPSAMKVSTGHLLRAVKYPDSTNTGTTPANIASDDSDVVSHGYNAQGQETYRKDQAGNVFETDYDDSGRQLHARVTTLASGFDGAVRRQSRTYDGLGRPSLVTQYDNATVGSGSVTDEVSYSYDGWGGITSYKQDKDGAVGGSGYYEVGYTYEKATGGRNSNRRTSMTVSGANTITIDYGVLDSPSRVAKLKDGTTVLAKYAYLGASRVVGTTDSEPNVARTEYDTASSSYDGYLDRFNRILNSCWWTLEPSTDKKFYNCDISYDRNSNITWVEDNVHSGFDVKYTMDDLDRLIDAEEGTRSGGSITSRTRQQTWTTLDHVGNWDRAKLDLNGDGDDTDTDEYDDTRTHNKVNELTARDTDTSGTNNYTLSYDAAGDLTDDGESYEYEYDAFYRLRKVRNQSSTLLAEYRYNGLGHMIGLHEDTDTDGDCDSSDLWFYPAFDEAWREVARYRESDSSPKEQFVNAMAGLDGYGRSSYINDVVCRNRDNTSGWLAASDGTLEERYFYCQNWRGDVSALVTSGRQLHEMDKYSAYGIPFGLPGGDTNSDGDDDSADATQIQTWIDTSTYDVRGDVDLDGDVDSTDKTLAQGAPITGNTLAWSVLDDDAFRNRRGIAGYEHALCTSLLIVRTRVLNASLGRWARRDPLGYVDGPSLYEYVRSAPLKRVDPLGHFRL